MANNKTQYLAHRVLDYTFCGGAFTRPTSLTVGIFTANPVDANEVPLSTLPEPAANSTTGYARQPVTFSSPSFGQIRNSVGVVFPANKTNWGLITHMAIFDNLGNMLVYGPISGGAQDMTQLNRRLEFDINSITITES